MSEEQATESTVTPVEQPAEAPVVEEVINSKAELHAAIEKDWKARSASKKSAPPVGPSQPVESVNPNAGLEAKTASKTGSMWDEMAQEFAPKPTQEELDEQSLEPEVKKSSGYQKLKAEKEQARAELAQMRAQIEQFSKQPPPPVQPAGPSPDVIALQNQVQMLTQTLTQLATPAPKPIDPNDPLNIVYQSLTPRFQQEVMAPVSAEVQELRAEMAALREERAAMAEQQAQTRAQAEKAALATSYRTQANSAMDNAFYSTSAMEDANAKSTLEQAVILLALARKISPEQAALQLKQANVHWAQGVEKKRNSPAIEKAQASGTVPRPAPEATTRALGGEATPDIKDLQAAGFKNYVQWQMAGSPNVQKKK